MKVNSLFGLLTFVGSVLGAAGLAFLGHKDLATPLVAFAVGNAISNPFTVSK